MENVYKRTGILFKILPCIFLVIFIGMICCSSCFASINFNYNDEVYDFPDIPSSLTFNRGEDTFKVSDYDYLLIIYYDNPNYGFAFILHNDDSLLIKDYSVDKKEIVIDGGFLSVCYDKTQSEYILAGSSKNTTSIYKPLSEITFSNVNIVNEDGSVVFQAPPQVGEAVIAKQIQPKEMNKTLQEIVGILPIVMIVVVSYLALRKALKMLSTSLRNS